MTIPDMQVSTDVIDFGDVKCGECCFVTIQLHNHQKVRCEWSFAPPSDKDKKQVKTCLQYFLKFTFDVHCTTYSLCYCFIYFCVVYCGLLY